MTQMEIGIASDHAGFELKSRIIDYLSSKDWGVQDFGTDSPESMDYPDVAHPLAKAIEDGVVDCGIALCGTGNGIAMTLNKHQGIRAAICWTPELAALAKQHNNANCLVLPARFIEPEKALEVIDTFFSSTFEGGRHQRRIDKIACK